MGADAAEQATAPSLDRREGHIYLEDVATEDLIWLGSADAPVFDRPLATGRYLLRYQAADAGESLPGNADAAIACIDLVGE